MEKSERAPQLKAISAADKPENVHLLGDPEVSAQPVFHGNLYHGNMIPTCCMDASKLYESPCTREHMNQEWRRQPASVLQHVEQMQSKPDQPASMNQLPHQLLDDCFTPHAEIMQSRARGECSYWGCGTVESTNRNTTCSHSLSDDEEELELPLPLKGDDEWQNQSHFLPPHSYNLQHMMDARRYYLEEEGQCNVNPGNTYPPQSFPHLQKWTEPKTWLQHPNSFMNDGVAHGGVSVNVPQFSVPPVVGLSQVSVQRLSTAATEETASNPQIRRTISLSEECRNVFITYSSDVSLEMVSFVEFLTKHGFRPAIDFSDNPVGGTDISKWADTYLKDPSTFIIIAISPKYKNDIGGSVVDSHGLHTKYIYSLMQNKFIQQGSMNFRFIPVLFLGAIQEHVPSWLQNSCVYRWPQDTEDLLLRLLKKERYVPPSVPVKLTLIIKPVTTTAASVV